MSFFHKLLMVWGAGQVLISCLPSWLGSSACQRDRHPFSKPRAEFSHFTLECKNQRAVLLGGVSGVGAELWRKHLLCNLLAGWEALGT